MADNKTDYIAPISLAASDLIDIKAKAAENMVSGKQEDVGVFELVETAYAKDYPRRLQQFADRVKAVRESDFYVEVVSYKDPLLNMLWVKNDSLKFIDRKSCPTPRPGHHVYHYDKRSDEIKFLWALPDELHIRIIKDNILDLASDLKDIIADIYRYEDGSLMAISDKMNGIDPNAPKDNRRIKLNDLIIETDTKFTGNKTKDKDVRHNEPSPIKDRIG